MTIEVICPLYNAEKYLENLDKAIKNQKNVNLKKITYVLTRSNDNTEEILKKLSTNYSVIEKSEFSHSLTREKVAMKSDADILVSIAQDIDIRNENWLYELVTPIENGEAEACFSRQIAKFDDIEKYVREKNYPEESYIASKENIEELKLKAFFFSNAASAIKMSVFKALNGYDGKNLPINEDMYLSYKLMVQGYKIKYCANSIIYHSHKFTLKQLYNRYYDTGKFFKENSYLDKYGTNRSGAELAIYVLKRALQDKNGKVLLQYLPNMITRFLGMKLGKYSIKK